MFQAVREQEKATDGAEDESEAGSEEVSDMSEEAPGKVAIADDELDDELSKEQQRKLHGDILDVITQFVKINNYQEHEYYGVTKQTLKQQQKKKAKQQAAQIQKEKDAKAEVPHPKEKPEKTKKSQQKRQSQQKESLQAGSNSGTNYQSNTLSVAQKRRSFNAAETSILPQKQVITNEQLSQQLQHMGGTRLRGGLASPLYYNLYQSTSNFSNFYVYRFDERNKQAANANSLHQQVLQQHGASSQQSYLNQEPISQDPSPQRNQKQQSSQVASGYHSVQNSETGKVYHLSKNTDGTGNHIMVSSNYGTSGSHPQQQYGGAFGSRKSHTKEHLPVDNSQSMIIGKTSSDQHHTQGNHSHVNEFSAQLEQMRHSQQQQAVQPMIFNFFNSKNEIKKRNHNRDHRQSERNNMLGTFQGASNSNNTNNEPGFHNRHSNKYSNNNSNNVTNDGVRKQASIPAGRGQMIESFFSVNSEVNGQSYTKHATSNNINQPLLDASTGVNERYPNVANQNKDQQSQQNSGAHFYRQKTNSVRTGVNHQKSQQAQNAQVVAVQGSTNARNLAKGGVSQKSRSSFQTRKQQFTELKEKQQQQQDNNKQQPYPKLDLSHQKSSPPSLASQQIKTQQQTKSAKFANIVAGAEIMKTQSQVDTPSGDQNNFQTLPRRQTKNSNTAGPLSNSNKDNMLAQFVKTDMRTDQLNQTHGMQADQSTFEGSSSELKRNAIRQIHPLKSFNGIPNDAQKSMSSTQGNKFGHQRQDDHQRRVALPNESIPEIGINKLIPVGPSISRGHQDSLNRQAQAQAMMVKKKTSYLQENDRQIVDGSTIHNGLHTSDLLEDHPSFIPRISLTSNGINPPQPMRHRLSFQDQSSIGHQHYQQQQLHNQNTGDYSNYKAVEGIDIIDVNNFYANQLKPKPQISKHFTAHSCEPSNRNGVGVGVGLRKKSSQFSAQHEPTLINNGSVVSGTNNTFMPTGQKKNDSQRLTNDHSSLRRSGDYQSKIHKQISSEPWDGGNPQQLILGTKQLSSDVVSLNGMAEKSETLTNHMNKMLTVSKPSFGQRVPPELYQKNPYMQQTTVGKAQQRSSASTGSKSELRFSASQNVANIDPIVQQTRSNNMVMIVTENESLQDSSRILASPNRVQIAQANTSHHQQSQESQQRTSQIQRNRLISQAQKLEGYSLNNPPLGKPNLPLTKSKTTVGQHQMVNGSNLQHTPSQGIQNIFADPNYGIGSVKNLQTGMTGKVGATTAASRHLNSPREEQIKMVPDTQALRDIKALWLKNNQPLKEQVGDQQQFNNIFEQQNLANNSAASHPNNTSAQKAIANGSIIRIQKLKYQGLIKQRGAPIIVHSPEQISRGVFNSNANTDRSNHHDDGFSSPTSQAKTSNQQIQMDIRDQQQQHHQQSKRVSSGPRGRRAGAPDPYDQCSEPLDSNGTLNFSGIKYGASMALDGNGSGSGAQERIMVQDAVAQSNHYATHKKFSLGSKPAQVIQQLNMDTTQRVSYTGLNSGLGSPSRRVNSMTRTGMSLNMASPKVIDGVSESSGLANNAQAKLNEIAFNQIFSSNKNFQVPDHNKQQQQSAVKPDSGASSTKKRQAPSIDSSTRKSKAEAASLKHPSSAKGAHVSGASGKKQTTNNNNSRGRAKITVKDKSKNS